MVNTALHLTEDTHSVATDTDNDLLLQFSLYQDEEAFAELVQRHGPMVMGVCRNVLQHTQDTEDAFQATFLVLARKAGSIRQGQALAGWLYRVAHRIALRARSRREKRQSQEAQSGQEMVQNQAIADPANDNRWMNEEVQKLPEKYRTPVLLCYMQGQTNEEAAKEMKCPTGTVKIRLMRARELLRKRLVRRGIAMSVTAVLVSWANSLRAAVPEAVQQTTVQLGQQWATGQSLATLELSETALQLVRGWFKKAALAKLKVGCLVLLTMMLLVLTEAFTQHASGSVVLAPTPAIAVPLERKAEPPEVPESPTVPEMDWIARTKADVHFV